MKPSDAEIEACARLLGVTLVSSIESYDYQRQGMAVHSGNPMNWRNWNPFNDDADLMALARAAKLCVNYFGQFVSWSATHFLSWPQDGTEAECIIRAAASVQIEREKANG